MKLINVGQPLRLTTHPGDEVSPTWSPDGRFIAFARLAPDEVAIVIVPALGGAERHVYSIGWRYFWLGENSPGLAWSPDGQFLAFPDKATQAEPRRIVLLSVDTGETRMLTSPPWNYGGDILPAFSPDGQTLAFARMHDMAVHDLYRIELADGELTQLTFDYSMIQGLAWTPDGSELVFASTRGGSLSLWRVSASGGAPQRLAIGGPHAKYPSLSRQGDRFAYEQELLDSNIWQRDIALDGQSPPARKLIASTEEDEGPQFSPDGQRIAFASARSGSYEIWVCQRDGSNPVQLTALGGPYKGSPRWSPDGRFIAFGARLESHSDILIINASGGAPRRLTTESSNDVAPSWSHDGQWIYFSSNRTGDWQIWKAPAEGGPAVQMTRRGGFGPFESADGHFVYYAKGFSLPGPWRAPVEGGEEKLVLNDLQPGYWGYWAVVENGLYFVNADQAAQPTIEFFNFSTHQTTRVATLEKPVDRWISGLAVSPDGQSLLYAQVDQHESDVMLGEPFR